MIPIGRTAGTDKFPLAKSVARGVRTTIPAPTTIAGAGSRCQAAMNASVGSFGATSCARQRIDSSHGVGLSM